MAGNVMTAASVNAQIAQDSVYITNFYHWLKDRYNVWITNAGNSTQMNTIGVTVTNDQNQIFAIQIDMNRLIGIFEGTLTTSTGSGVNILQDLTFVRGNN